MKNYIKYNGGSLWTCESGQFNARPVLLCNGGPGCCDYLKPVADLIDDKCRVIRFELRGCGCSTEDGLYDLATAIGDIERLRLHYGIDHWIIGGHSWGANLAFVYAMTHPERVRALLYIAGNGIQNDRNWNEEYHRNLDERGERLPDMDYPFNTAVNMAGNRTLREFGRAPDFYLRVSRMDMPALFVMAENDIRPSWPAEQLASLMLGAKIVRVKDASHFIWLDNPKELQKVLSEFISQL